MTANTHDYLYSILEAHVAQCYHVPEPMQDQLTDLLFATFAPAALEVTPIADPLPVKAFQAVAVEAPAPSACEQCGAILDEFSVCMICLRQEANAYNCVTPQPVAALTQTIPGTRFPPLPPPTFTQDELAKAQKAEPETEADPEPLSEWIEGQTATPEPAPVPAPAPILTGTDAAKQKAKDYIFDCLAKKEGVDSRAIHGLTGMESSDVRKFITACQDEYTQLQKRKAVPVITRQEAGLSALIAAINDVEDDAEEESPPPAKRGPYVPRATAADATPKKRGGWKHSEETKAILAQKARDRRSKAVAYTNGGAQG